MNSELSRVLKREFHTKMRRCLPAFQKTDSEFGGVVYRKHDPDNDRYIFVFLERHSLGESCSPGSNLNGKFGTVAAANSRVKQSVFGFGYRIRTFLDRKLDGWWKVNVPDSPLPDLDAIMKTFTPEAVQKGLANLPGLVEDAFNQLRVALPKFIATLEKSKRKA